MAAPTLDVASATPARCELNAVLAMALHEADRRLEGMVGEFLRVHSRFVERFPGVAPQVDGGDLDLALLKAAAATQMEEGVLKEVSSNAGKEENGLGVKKREEGSKVEAKVVSERGGQRKGEDKEKGAEKGVQGTEANTVRADRFVPVDKTVYNRLPRNLKIRAGKFAEINQFYERVWGVLKECGGPMKEKLLVQKVGEKDASRLEVLRGLAVIRAGRDGWMLAEKMLTRKVRR